MLTINIMPIIRLGKFASIHLLERDLLRLGLLKQGITILTIT